MDSQEHIQRYRSQSSLASWPEPLWHALLGYFEQTPVVRLSYHHMPPFGAPDEGRVRVVAQGYPDAWLHRYIRKKLYRVDPIALHSATVEMPFSWRDIRDLRDLSDDERTFLAELDDAGFDNGLAIPAFAPGGRTGFFGLGYRPDDDLPGPETVFEYACVCQHAHLLYCRMIRKQLPEVPALSSREREILSWVARGKSNSVIAEIMDLSPHTIDAHIRRIFLKLGTSDRVSAAVRGLGVGAIRSG